MKKIIFTFTIFSLLSLAVMPAMAETDVVIGSGTTVGTGFTRSEGSGEMPIIKVKWEMNNNQPLKEVQFTSPLDDDLDMPGAQFLPTGEWDTNKGIYVCAVATDPDGVADIDAVYADIFYPEQIALGPDHEDVGCGEQHGLEIELQELEKMAGYELLCNNVRINHYDLPEWNVNGLYDYDEVCAEDGELMKETARVYCKYTTLKWEDPAGMYRVQVHAADNGGLDSEPLMNQFEYLPLTAFEVDFDSIVYGSVKLNTHKIINGDLTWDETMGANPASVRNIGNTRLNMTVWQDDMGLGETENGDRWWNVMWDARVGSNATFSVFEPYQEGVVLDNTLELSHMDEMDFSILVNKFPLGSDPDGNGYSGKMILGAVFTDFLTCGSS